MATIERAIPVGGASLNFAVVGGTTQPSNPKENTVWVNTATDIIDWAFASMNPFLLNVNLKVSAKHASNGSSTDITIVDNNTHTTVASETVTGNAYYSEFTDKVISFTTADGAAGTLTCSVRQNTSPYFIGTVVVAGVTVGTVGIGTNGSNSSYDWSGEQDATAEIDLDGRAGRVWVQTDAAAPNAFNALKKNALMAYPIGVFMCDGSAWATAKAQIYRGGEWRGFELMLYERGKLYNEDVIPILSNGALFKTDCINLQYQSGTNVRGIYTQTAAPSGYSTVHMIVRVDIADSANHTTNVQYGQNALTASLPSIVSSGSGRVSYESATIPKTETEITIDITGAYGFFIGCTNTGRSAYVYKIWLT